MKNNKIAAIFLLKCPRCKKGEMFQHTFLGKPHKFNKMHEECPVCGQNFYPELGFYTGAMYFSYGFNVAIIVTVFIAATVLAEPSLPTLLAITLLPAFLFAPINFRISRALMLHLFGGVESLEKEDGQNLKP